jgi:hypothetical protein
MMLVANSPHPRPPLHCVERGRKPFMDSIAENGIAGPDICPVFFEFHRLALTPNPMVSVCL